jgi:putative hemolysin
MTMFLNPSNDLGPVCILKRDSFARKIPLFIDAGDYFVKTAESWDELRSVFKLRNDVFSQEYGITLGNGSHPGWQPGLDIDQFDELCDHLVVFYKKSGIAVGTYRLLSSEFTDTFYSQQEFIFQSILDYPGTKLELGRACIDPLFRNGTVMRLLWTGVAQYVREVGAEILFGCSSIKTIDPVEAASVYRYLRDRGHVSEKFATAPALKYRMSGFKSALQRLDSDDDDAARETAGRIVSPLLLSYLKACGKVCGEPAVDLEFHCIDFLTVLQTRELSQTFERRFRLC